MIIGEVKPSLEELSHYGIVGMKWGRRKGGLGERFKGALADHNQQATAILTRMKEGRGKHLDEKIAGAYATATHLGRGRRNKAIDKRLGDLKAQRERLDKGKLKVRDILDIIGNVSTIDLFVSRQDNRG